MYFMICYSLIVSHLGELLRELNTEQNRLIYYPDSQVAKCTLLLLVKLPPAPIIVSVW